MALYNLKSSDGQWRITKFTNDLDVEASYITSEAECECPAGNRPTCRHRQMLPRMLNVGAEDSGMFYDFDTDQFLEPIADSDDTQPAIVSPIEDEVELPPQAAQDMLSPSTTEPKQDEYLEGIGQRWPLVKPHSTTVSAAAFDAADIGSNPVEAATVHPAISGTLKRRI